MLFKETQAKCCINHEPLPADINCLSPHVCKEFYRLYRQHCKAFTKNQRIMQLAKPKPLMRGRRFVNRCPCFLQKNIEIIRLNQRANTRTEQLAYPRARQLLLFKKAVQDLFPLERIANINRFIRKSLFSVYSRLGNVQPPMERQIVPKWTRSEWRLHTKLLKKLAKHKVVKQPIQVPSKTMPLQSMKRYKYLSKPKKSYSLERPVWVLTLEMRKHKASERTLALAKPIMRDTTMLYQELPIQIPETVLKHKASSRTKDLSRPNSRRTGKSIPSDLREDPFAIVPNALKAKASKRTKELASPKEYENVHIRDDPYAISKAALNAKAKPRTIELATPKKR